MLRIHSLTISNMDLDEIKKFVPGNGERYIFIENGKPVLVLMSFKDYKNKNQFSNQKEIEFKETPKPSQSKKEESELTVEDLPF